MNFNTELSKNELENIGRRLRSLIESNGMLQKDFAILSNITPQTLSKIINGKYNNLSLRLVEKFSQILHVSTNYILCKSNNPGGDNFKLSDDWFERNAQHFYISKVINYLRSFNYTITELVIINDIEFKLDDKTLTFTTFASKKDLLEYGISFTDTSSVDMYVEYECTEEILIEIIKSPHTHATAHYWEIEFQDTIVRVDEQQFLDTMYSFALLTQNYFSAAIYGLNKTCAKLTDIGMTINKKKQDEIAQGAWQPPTSDEQHQKLLRAVYGENIPDTPKKEE